MRFKPSEIKSKCCGKRSPISWPLSASQILNQISVHGKNFETKSHPEERRIWIYNRSLLRRDDRIKSRFSCHLIYYSYEEDMESGTECY